MIETDWDRRFMDVAQLVASWSKDPSTQCGAVLVRPDKTIASVGFNGFPRGTSDAEELYADRPTKYGRVIHAEVNAILHSCDSLLLDGYSLYVTPCPPCDRCAAVIVQTGIRRICCNWPTAEMNSRWSEAFNRAHQMYKEAGVQVTLWTSISAVA